MIPAKTDRETARTKNETALKSDATDRGNTNARRKANGRKKTNPMRPAGTNAATQQTAKKQEMP